ncbi:MAG TPA: helix-turn-helix domain-containing protein [Mycobacteriales bacterium]|jgi:predicted ArsR family transcriptional regulator
MDDLAAVAALDQPVRRDLYDLVRDEWVGRDEAAATLGVPRSVAAFHLDKLAGAGLLDVTYVRPPGRSGPGAGRPAKRYRRAAREVAVSLPERHYELAGAMLADAVSDAAAHDRPVGEALADAARAAGEAMGAEVRGSLPLRATVAATREATVAALRRLGYEPRVEGRDVVLANCPFHALAERHRELVCGMNLRLLAGLAEGLGAAERLAPRLAPAPGRCCVRLRA